MISSAEIVFTLVDFLSLPLLSAALMFFNRGVSLTGLTLLGHFDFFVMAEYKMFLHTIIKLEIVIKKAINY